MSGRVNEMVIDGNMDAESVSTLYNRLVRCKNNEGNEVFEWLETLAGIYTQLRVAGAPVPDLEMKHRAMSLRGDGIFIGDGGSRQLQRLAGSYA